MKVTDDIYRKQNITKAPSAINNMGNLKTFALTCLGVGLAAGAGFYLYRKFVSVNEDADQNTESKACKQSSASQVTVRKNKANLKN